MVVETVICLAKEHPFDAKVYPCFSVPSVRPSGSFTVVFFQARMRRDFSPNSFMMDPTVPAATLIPWPLRILVSWSRPAI